MPQYFKSITLDALVRLFRQSAKLVRGGGVIVYPTDSCYALGCRVGDKEAASRIRAIRELDDKHLLTLMCRDMSEVAQYARVNDRQFRLIKSATPGSYVFILQATREVPRRLQHPSRRTIGVRLPEHPIVQGLLRELGEPLVTSTLQLPGDPEPLDDAQTIRERIGRRVDLVIDGGHCGVVPTTVVQLTGDTPIVTREGKGSTALFAT
jgi:tRNA threonylcarbamoyl adenosine modification protein (Sua5/YciO/YrdC/YwlC family)